MVRLFCVTTVVCLLALAGDRSASLDTETDRTAFCNWFAFLAEAQYFTPQASRAPEVTDCSSLVRYAYREALRRHDSQWAAHANLILIPALPSLQKYNYPATPTGPRLFVTAPQHYAEFADAQTLYRFNVFPVARTLAQARRGDLLFFRQVNGTSRYHTMIVLDTSQITHDASRFVVYDTGPEGSKASTGRGPAPSGENDAALLSEPKIPFGGTSRDLGAGRESVVRASSTKPGQIKRLTYQELLHFPEPRWRPLPENHEFLGVFRWNILKD